MEPLITVTSAQPPPANMRLVEKVPPEIMVKLSLKKISPQRSPPINSQVAAWYCPNV